MFCYKNTLPVTHLLIFSKRNRSCFIEENEDELRNSNGRQCCGYLILE